MFPSHDRGGLNCAHCSQAILEEEAVFIHTMTGVGHVATHRDCMLWMMVNGNNHLLRQIELLQERLDSVLIEGERVSANYLVRSILEPDRHLSRTEIKESARELFKKVQI